MPDALSQTYEIGERVRIDIPDESDPDFQYHWWNGEVISVIPDDAGSIMGDPQNYDLYISSSVM